MTSFNPQPIKSPPTGRRPHNIRSPSRNTGSLIDPETCVELCGLDLDTLSNIGPNQASSVVSLLLSRNNFVMAPVNIEMFRNIEVLDMSECKITEFSISFCNSTMLRELRLSNNTIPAIPVEISRLNKSKVLIIHHNSIPSVPDEIGRLVRLEEFDLSHNHSTGGISSKIGDCWSSQVSRSQSCQLTRIPDEISQSEQSMESQLSHNALTQLPSDIGNSYSLKLLLSHGNRLTNLPTSIGRCKGLGSPEGQIQIGGNPFTDPQLIKLNSLESGAIFSQLQSRYNEDVKRKEEDLSKPAGSTDQTRDKVYLVARWTILHIPGLKDRLWVMKKQLAPGIPHSEADHVISTVEQLVELSESSRKGLPQIRPVSQEMGSNERKKAERNIVELNLTLSAISKASTNQSKVLAVNDIVVMTKYVRAMQNILDQSTTKEIAREKEGKEEREGNKSTRGKLEVKEKITETINTRANTFPSESLQGFNSKGPHRQTVSGETNTVSKVPQMKQEVPYRDRGETSPRPIANRPSSPDIPRVDASKEKKEDLITGEKKTQWRMSGSHRTSGGTTTSLGLAKTRSSGGFPPTLLSDAEKSFEESPSDKSELTPEKRAEREAAIRTERTSRRTIEKEAEKGTVDAPRQHKGIPTPIRLFYMPMPTCDIHPQDITTRTPPPTKAIPIVVRKIKK